MSRPFTESEVQDFLANSLNVHPSECEEPDAYEFSEINMNRDAFDEQLQLYVADNNIPLDFDSITYRTDRDDDMPMEIFVARIPFLGVLPC